MHAQRPLIEVLGIVNVEGKPRFCRHGVVKSASQLRFLACSLLGVSVVDNVNIPCVADWKDGTVNKLFPNPDIQVCHFIQSYHYDVVHVTIRAVLLQCTCTKRVY